MDLKRLNYFVTIVNCKSYSKAAEKLHISQPSLSNAVKKLEQEIGAPLLERSTRKFVLTDAGELLYLRASDMLSQMKIMNKEMEEVIVEGKGVIVLGIIESIKTWLPSIIYSYKQRYPVMVFKLFDVLGAEHVIRSLKSYSSHAIITNQLIYDEDIVSIPLYTERLVAVLPYDHPLSQKELLHLDDLEQETFIISTDGFQTRADVINAFKTDNLQLKIHFEIERFETALSLVRENLGITIVSENYVNGAVDKRIIQRPIDHPMLERTVYLAYMKNRHLPIAMQQFIQAVEQNF
ncbi:LysR family transcriptional regulator [Viridibacillus sp. YIM B01967]|uniref:LysR family transcriptional regulator n=1 Tax=Viridibacillus soli TaxID=2798301 RepID=A0ABS1H2S1_9BACL|nr:LysR family transcriptional regulator [Viridibacillus soli]MBK3493467.1 LysR family transcriptional regulator [Viridibacillus soli]